ncbi:MAG: hypothetical protein ABH844_00145 [Candidatus Omnitrophota bacterium]
MKLLRKNSNLIIFFVLAVFFSSIISCPSISLSSEIDFLPMQKGMCYVTWDKNKFSSYYSDESLEKLVSMGVEYVSITPTHYQESFASTDIKSTDQTTSISSLIHAIKKSHALGLKVMIKPHIDLIDKYDGTYWRADIGFSNEKDWQKWFTGYKKLMNSYASICEKHNVELFCVGTELAFAAQKTSEWRIIISSIRGIYSGRLVYAANWDNFKNIGFWDDLDYIGINAFFPLSQKTNPSLEDLKNGWNKWKQDLQLWQGNLKKPIIFTEIGYPSIWHAPNSPWQNPGSGNCDLIIQAKCYKAFFETIWTEPWLAGVYWWKWDTNIHAGGKNNRNFTPQNKPAQEIIEAHYK